MGTNDELKLSVVAPTVKEYKNIEYYIGFLGLILIGILLAFHGVAGFTGNFYSVLMILGALLVLLSASNIVLENAVKLAESLGVSEMVIMLMTYNP